MGYVFIVIALIIFIAHPAAQGKRLYDPTKAERKKWWRRK